MLSITCLFSVASLSKAEPEVQIWNIQLPPSPHIWSKESGEKELVFNRRSFGQNELANTAIKGICHSYMINSISYGPFTSAGFQWFGTWEQMDGIKAPINMGKCTLETVKGLGYFLLNSQSNVRKNLFVSIQDAVKLRIQDLSNNLIQATAENHIEEAKEINNKIAGLLDDLKTAKDCTYIDNNNIAGAILNSRDDTIMLVFSKEGIDSYDKKGLVTDWVKVIKLSYHLFNSLHETIK